MAALVPDVSMFVPGHHLASGFVSDAKGSYSNVACINPIAAQRWFESMTFSSEDALEMESRIQFFMRSCIEPFIKDLGFSNTAADKFLAAVGGWSGISPCLR